MTFVTKSVAQLVAVMAQGKRESGTLATCKTRYRPSSCPEMSE